MNLSKLSSSLTPRQAARVLGVSESTVRRWCDAGLVRSTKTTGGHRRIERQALVEFARRQQLKVLDTGPLSTGGRGGRLPDADVLSSRFYHALLDGEGKEVNQFTRGLLERTGDVAAFCDDLVAPTMHRIGREWSQGELRIFREHAATERALEAVAAARYHIATPEKHAYTAVCAALVGDPYVLAPSMCSVVLQAAGFRTVSLGSNTPGEEIIPAAIDFSASLITISVSVPPVRPEALVRLCTEAEDQGIRVAVGGRRLSAALRRKLKPDFFGDTMGHLSAYANRLMRDLHGRREVTRAQ